MYPIAAHAPLASLTTLGLGGPADELCEVVTTSDAIDAVREADARGIPVTVLGGGSNVVVADRGVRGRVVRVLTRGVWVDKAPDGSVCFRVAAGEPWDDFVARTVADGRSGIECLSGIPGHVGATPIQNVGAYGQEVSDSVVCVRVWDRLAGSVVTLARAACGFGYRDSVFKSAARGRYLVLEVTYRLLRTGPPAPRYGDLVRALGDAESTVANVRLAVLSLRRARSMVLDPSDPDSRSVGSFFTNPVVSPDVAEGVRRQAHALGVLAAGERPPSFAAPDGAVKLAAGWLIEHSGIVRGMSLGGVAVSNHHALALVHRGGGTTEELISLARRVQSAVRASFGVELTPEAVFVGFATENPLADLATPS